ncbi:MAG TPA: DUF1223 domain-containing protein [Thermoanaerobaculia bacterium]|nr:DUF1223 domain-containing protein [Thermoanaerobaculia bacterium]
MRRLDPTSCSSRWWLTRRVLLVASVVATLCAGAAGAAVLVELFTAQGCSSCPPADRLLTAMGSDPDLGSQVVPLAFHVTYWNTDAWHDRFSDAAWTKRQKEYVIGAGGERIYTPQMVIAGGAQCVGSDVKCIKAGVEAAAAKAQGAVSVAPAVRGGELAVTVTAQAPAGQKSLDVMVALFESGLDTDVRGGENAHKTLHDDYVVRRLQRAFKVSGEGQRQEAVTLKLDPSWQRGKLGVAAFLQDPKTRQVFGAAAMPVPQ